MEKRLITTQPQWWYPYAITVPIGLLMFVWIALNESSSEQKADKPSREQHTEGSNSPIIVGDGNTVIINPIIINPYDVKQLEGVIDKLNELVKPKVEPKAEQKVAQTQKFDRNKIKTLTEKYPLGYAIFELNHMKNQVNPYASLAFMDNYELDWKKVKYTENTQGQYKITLPDIKLKDGGFTATNSRVSGYKKVGDQRGIYLDITVANVNKSLWIKSEILSIKPEGIVFLVGLERG